MLRHKYLYTRLSFGELRLQLRVGCAERVRLRCLLGMLLREHDGGSTVRQASFQRSAGKVILSPAHGELCVLPPFRLLYFVFPLLLQEAMLVCNRKRDLRLDLQQLVLQIEDNLLGQLLRIFCFIQQVVEIGTKQGGNTFKKWHG